MQRFVVYRMVREELRAPVVAEDAEGAIGQAQEFRPALGDSAAWERTIEQYGAHVWSPIVSGQTLDTVLALHKDGAYLFLTNGVRVRVRRVRSVMNGFIPLYNVFIGDDTANPSGTVLSDIALMLRARGIPHDQPIWHPDDTE